MPRVAPFRVAALDELYRQLRFAPADTRRRQMDAAERLVGDLDPDRNYPEDFIVYRITGYRPDRVEAPATLVGEALLPDLVNLVQRLSSDLELPPDHGGRRAVPLPEAARLLSVSMKTLQRYRRQGLVCHYVRFEPTASKLGCFVDALERFAERHRAKLERAASFSRIERAVEHEIIGAAKELRATEGTSLNETARRLSKRYDRAHETIRNILRRHERRAPEPIFAEHGPLAGRDLKLVYRAVRFGVPVPVLARRFRKARSTIHRALNRYRFELLCGLDLSGVELPTFTIDDAGNVILAARSVRTWDADPPARDAAVLLERAHRAPPADRDALDEMIAAYHFLKRCVREHCARAEGYPSSGALDRDETDLRWAARLKERLVLLLLPTAIVAIERHLHRPLARQPGERIRELLRVAVEVLSTTVETLDPSRGQRADRLANLNTDRVLARRPIPEETGRAAARHADGALLLPDDLFWNLAPWQGWLDLPPWRRAGIDRLEASAADLVRQRYGLAGGPPRTLEELADLTGMSTIGLGRALGEAEISLRRLAVRSDGA